MTKSMLSVLLLASYLSAASAATCYAVGYIDTNSVMVEGPLTSSTGVYVYDADDNKIGEGSSEKGACTDLDTMDLDGYDDTFSWGSSCNANSFQECHGAYSTQTHIEGLDPEDGDDFYGIGVSTSSQCKVEFDC